MCGLFTIEFQNKFRPINHRQRRHMTFVNQSLSMLPLSYVDIKINKNKQIRWLLVGLPDKTWSSIFDNLFLVKMSLTIRVILEKAPFWMSVIKLFVKFTDRSLVWVEKTRGVSRSEKKRRKKKLLENRAVDHEPIFRMDCLKKLLQIFFTYSWEITFTEVERSNSKENYWLNKLLARNFDLFAN